MKSAIIVLSSLVLLAGCSSLPAPFSENTEPAEPVSMRLMMPEADARVAREPSGRIVREFLSREGYMCRVYVDLAENKEYRCKVEGRWRRLIPLEIEPAPPGV